MEPYTSGLYADYHAPFIFKTVEGDFVTETKLLISGKENKTPQTTGVFIRDNG